MVKKIKKRNRLSGRPPVHSGYSLVKPLQVRKYLNNIRKALIRDLAAGDETNLSASELILVDSLISMLAVTRCMEIYISKTQVMDDKGNVAPCLRNEYLRYRRTIREHLITLGLNVRTFDDSPTLEKVVADIVSKRGSDEQSD